MELPPLLWARVSELLSGREASTLEAAVQAFWAFCQAEAVWRERLRREFPAAPCLFEEGALAAAPASGAVFKRQYLDFAQARLLKPGKTAGSTARGKGAGAIRLKAGRPKGLRVLLSLQGEAFVVWQLRGHSDHPSFSGSWPLVGLVEDSEKALELLTLRSAARVCARAGTLDISEREDIWSLCLLDNWVWSRNAYVQSPHLPAWGAGFDQVAEVGISISRGRVAFFRRISAQGSDGPAPWSTTGVVWDLATVEAGAVEAACGGPRGAGPPSRLARPVVIGNEDGVVQAELLGILPRAPFDACCCEEALRGPWTV